MHQSCLSIINFEQLPSKKRMSSSVETLRLTLRASQLKKFADKISLLCPNNTVPTKNPSHAHSRRVSKKVLH